MSLMKGLTPLFAVFLALMTLFFFMQEFTILFFLTYPYLATIVTVAIVSVPWLIFFYFDPRMVRSRWNRSFRGLVFPAAIEVTDPKSGRTYIADSFERAELGITHTELHDDHYRMHYASGHIGLTAALIVTKGPPDVSSKEQGEVARYVDRINRIMSQLPFQYTASLAIRPAKDALESLRTRKAELEIAVQQAKDQKSKNLADYERDLTLVKTMLKRADEHGDKILEGVHYTLISVKLPPNGRLEIGLAELDNRVGQAMVALTSTETEVERATRYDLLDILKTVRAGHIQTTSLLSGPSLNMIGLYPFITPPVPKRADGFLIGVTRPGEIPVFASVDVGEAMNPHICLVGDTGSGKTTTINTIIAQAVAQGKKLLIFDSQGDMIPFAVRYGGKILTLGENAFWNPFAFSPREETLETKQASLVKYFTDAFELSEPQFRWLEGAISDTYRGVGIYEGQKKSWRKPAPFIETLIHTLAGYLSDKKESSPEHRSLTTLNHKLKPLGENPRGHGIYSESLVAEGDDDEYFDLQAWKLLDGFYVLDMRFIPDTTRRLITLLLTDQLKYVLKERGVPGSVQGLVVYDEAKNLTPEGKKMDENHLLVTSMLEWRKYGWGMVVATQEPQLLPGPLTTQPDTLIVHRLNNPTAQKDMAHALRLPKDAASVIQTLQIGEAYIRTMKKEGVRTQVDMFKVPPIVTVHTRSLVMDEEREERSMILAELNRLGIILNEEHLMIACNIMPGMREQEDGFYEALDDLIENVEIEEAYLQYPDRPSPDRLFGLPGHREGVRHTAMEEYILTLLSDGGYYARRDKTPDIRVGKKGVAIEVESGLKKHSPSDIRQMVDQHEYLLRVVIVPDKLPHDEKDLVAYYDTQLRGLRDCIVLPFSRCDELMVIMERVNKQLAEEASMEVM